MYSPEISPKLIGDLYRWAKSEKVPMTKLVNRILSKEIEQYKQQQEEENELATAQGG